MLCMQLVARSCTLSGLSIWCGCIHGCTLSVANTECTNIVMC